MSNSHILQEKVSKAINQLVRTYPEQTADAMSDYMKAYHTLKSVGEDWQITNVLQQLKNLYIYPTRKRHNDLINDLHELKETLDELSIKEASSQSQKDSAKKRIKKTLKGLGAFDIQTLPTPVWVALGALAAHIYKSKTKKE